uniref:Uncharacterized protein n=1 Tax=uncultured organism TaxID=155900 RepID=W0NQ93_9ZZZZ|nr:hypothetical protein META_00032 [uncultured organism]
MVSGPHAAIVAGAAGIGVGIAKVIENFELPAALRVGIGDHPVELGVFIGPVLLLRVKVDAEVFKLLIFDEHVDRAAAKGRDIVERLQLRQILEGTVHGGLLELGQLRDLPRRKIDPLEPPAADFALDLLQHAALGLGLLRQQIHERRQVALDPHAGHILPRIEPLQRASVSQ